MVRVNVQPGDVGFARNPGFATWCIRFAEACKYGRDTGNDSPAHWNHCFLIISTAGDLLEAQPNGITANTLAAYEGLDTAVLRPPYPPTPFLGSSPASVVQMRAMQGQAYAFGSIMSDALSLLFGSTLRIGFVRHHTCSGAVAHALNLSGIDMGDDEEWNSPADNWAILRKLGATEVAL